MSEMGDWMRALSDREVNTLLLILVIRLRHFVDDHSRVLILQPLK